MDIEQKISGAEKLDSALHNAKKRIEMPSEETAREYQRYHGGWIVRQENTIYHYSYNYCRFDIMADIKGSFEII